LLLRAAAERAPSGVTVDIASIRDIPLYDGDLEREQGVPPPVRELQDRIARADGLLLVTPEYNTSLPGVLKNAIDWLTRPPAEIKRVFGGRPVAVMGASPGRLGTVLAQTAWLPVLRTLGTEPWFGGRMIVAGAAERFDEAGKLTDGAIAGELERFM